MFENQRKSLIQDYERTELSLHYGQKLMKNAKKWSIMASFWKSKACGQTMLLDRSVLLGHKLVENTQIEKLKWDILSNFQTSLLKIMNISF